jgi:hypothetical protein
MDGITKGLLFFQCKLVGGGINLAKVVKTGVSSAGASGADKIRNLNPDKKDNPKTANQKEADFGFGCHGLVSLRNQKTANANQAEETN